ncbi:hypothetical protein NLG97_g2904 [Lecanicillium saksenae]|uniref:Uncharacterized protein n=1 Tax=Lecanicillium saksenae TaxID=468837 RepID=A0ACC1R3L7_9HYPO|nr:hypothetical protein NLG97_g2904 [Lecanicillium saksenae]
MVYASAFVLRVGARIISLPVNEDGLLGEFTSTSTGGLGRYSTEGPNYTYPITDQLTSQNAVVVSGNSLFTVNPGSNTVSLFNIPKDDPTHPSLVGKPASSGGDFPVSVAYSHALHVACVLNGGNVAGIQCFKVDDRGLHLTGSFIPVDLNQTSPPHGPTNTASDIVFNPSSTALFATIKGDFKGDGVVAGHFAALPVVNGQVVANPRVSRPPGFAFEWSISFINDTTAAVSDPSIGAAFATVAYPSLDITFAKDLPVDRLPKSAVCWSEYSERFDALYFFDGYTGTVPVIDPKTGLHKYNMTAPVPEHPAHHPEGGLYDSVVAGTYLYVLGGTSQIHVFSLLGSRGNGKIPSVIQTKDLTSVGTRRGWQGMAAWPNGF